MKTTNLENISFNLANFRLGDYTDSVINLASCHFKNISNPLSELNEISIENCSISGNIILEGAIMLDRFILKNCTVSGKTFLLTISFKGVVIIENNVFNDFVDFNDSSSEESLILTGNRFNKGTNLLGNRGKPYEVHFRAEDNIDSNIGSLDLNQTIDNWP